jgi:hypothetical protein
MVWDGGGETALHARRPCLFRFRLEDGAGKPASVMELSMGMLSAELPPGISFPSGFPKPGDAGIFVQVKRAGGILTGVFDAKVEN